MATVVGNLYAPHRARVDRAGTVTLDGAAWSLAWWIGAEDRWHVPADEITVRQALLGSTPVVETRVRVPSGDAVQRVYAAIDARGAQAVVVEVENETKVPFAVALAVRPLPGPGAGGVGEVAVDGAVVLVGGRRVLDAGKAPGRVAVCDGTDDVATIVLAGAAADTTQAYVRCAEGGAQAAIVFPLAHTAVMRVVLPLPPGGEVQADLLPDVAQVVSGWQAQTSRGARIVVPDRTLQAAVESSVRHLLLVANEVAAVAPLTRFGFGAEVAEGLLTDPLAAAAAAPTPGSALHAVAGRWRDRHDAVTAELAPAVVAHLVVELGNVRQPAELRFGAAGAEAAASLLATAGQRRAAKDARRAAGALARRAAEQRGPEVGATLRRLTEHLAAAAPTWTWPDGAPGNAEVLLLAAELLAREADGPERILELAPVVPDRWLGQGWEVHDLITAYGRLSYAVRWHGDRPALLWDVSAPSDAPPVRLLAPGLDPTWSSTAAKGEALLQPVALPEPAPSRGVSTPVALGRRPVDPT
ncbi:MAG: hypothetical protein Q8K58_07530 [Acidimicrobiales bacterium]|nr:hypothetical protein [Acidimicrobiales bacterium]